MVKEESKIERTVSLDLHSKALIMSQRILKVSRTIE